MNKITSKKEDKQSLNSIINNNDDSKYIQILNKKTKRIKKWFRNSKKQEPVQNLINDKNKYNNNPENINFFSFLIKDSFINDNGVDNIFITFNSINDIYILIYPTEDKSIIAFDLIDNKKIIEIKDAHEYYICSFRHYLDKKNKRDLVVSISAWDNNMKLWNINNWECLYNFKKVYSRGELNSGCFLKHNNNIYIITCNDNYPDKSYPIKVFNIYGKTIKILNDSNERTFFLQSYYDKKTSKKYIIAGNQNYIKSYDYNSNKVYHKYYDNKFEFHSSIIISKVEEVIQLFECSGSTLKVWNFHTAELLKTIKLETIDPNCTLRVFCVCLWNNDHIFVSCNDKSIKLVNLKNGQTEKILIGHNSMVLTIKKLFIPKYGECLFSKGDNSDKIILWNFYNYYNN